MAGSSSSTFVVLSAVGGNFVVTVAKFIGWFLTGSPSMLAEGIHSLADTTNQALLYVGIRHSEMGPSPKFPWGRGNARYLWNLISAMGIFFVGFGVTTYHGVASLFHAHESPGQDQIGTIVGILIFALVVEGFVLYAAYRAVSKAQGDKSLWKHLTEGDDPTSVAVLLEDSVAVLGVICAMIGIGVSYYTGSTLADSIASIFIGCLLGAMAVLLAFINGRLLIGVSTTKKEVEQIREFLENQPSVEKVLVLKTRIGGPGTVRIAAEVEFHGGTLVDREQIERDAQEVRNHPDELVPTLVDTAERMVRVMGREINRIEKELLEKFPKVAAIELEVN